MRISELAKKTGCTSETIRYYESRALLQPPARTSSNYRVYGEEHVRRLSFIRHCRSLDMSLDEIRLLIDLQTLKNRDLQKAHGIVHKHLSMIDEKISELRRLRAELEQLHAGCSQAEHELGRCGVIDGLDNNRTLGLNNLKNSRAL